MSIVLAGGDSIRDYDRLHLSNLARLSFTYAINEVAFDFPCDVVVALDYSLLNRRRDDFERLGKPIITRGFDCNKKLGLDLIELPESIITLFKYSGMVACKLSDRMAATTHRDKSYVLGMDASVGRYKGHQNQEHSVYNGCPLSAYEDMNLTHTINLSVSSKICYWPKMSKLPNIKKTIVHGAYRAVATTWLRTQAAVEIYHDMPGHKPRKNSITIEAVK